MADTITPEITPADARAALRRAARALIEADGLTAVTLGIREYHRQPGHPQLGKLSRRLTA